LLPRLLPFYICLFTSVPALITIGRIKDNFEESKLPIYEFRCLSCGNIEEFILVGSRQIEMKCGACGGEDLERIVSRSNHVTGPS
jgi:putative FmdB family regulatory protein